MKQLGFLETYFSTDKEHQTKRTYLGNYNLNYLEPQKEVILEFPYENVDESGYTFELHKPWFFNCKEYKIRRWFHYDDHFIIKPGQTLYKKLAFEPLGYTMSYDELSKYLDADKFIEYLKDHGLTVCPIKA